MKKISETMRRKKLDNFAQWRERMRALGKIPSGYPNLRKDGDLAELIGVILGDGHIEKFPRTEAVTISSNANNVGFIDRYSKLLGNIFGKKPNSARMSGVNCVRIRIFQKNISKRLGIPLGARRYKKVSVPRWIFNKKEYIVRYLRGLYEAEGSFCIHAPTSTYKLLFSNRNEFMLRNVFRLMKHLGFHPHRSKSKYSIQISRREEVYKAIKLLKFRSY